MLGIQDFVPQVDNHFIQARQLDLVYNPLILRGKLPLHFLYCRAFNVSRGFCTNSRYANIKTACCGNFSLQLISYPLNPLIRLAPKSEGTAQPVAVWVILRVAAIARPRCSRGASCVLELTVDMELSPPCSSGGFGVPAPSRHQRSGEHGGLEPPVAVMRAPLPCHLATCSMGCAHPAATCLTHVCAQPWRRGLRSAATSAPRHRGSASGTSVFTDIATWVWTKHLARENTDRCPTPM